MAKSGGALMALLAVGKKPKAEGPSSDEDMGKAYSKVGGDDDGDEAEEMTNDGASYDAASESLLQQLNVPQGRRASVKAALKKTIHACLRGNYEEE